VKSREFAPWPDQLEACRQNARILQGKYQDAAAALDRAHQALARIADLHVDNRYGVCEVCMDTEPCAAGDCGGATWPCETYRIASGAES
jgi:hypothetical protein